MNILDEFSDDEEISNEYVTNNYIKNDINTYNENIIIDKDYESIFTLSNLIVIQNNKKIQFIKQMLNYLLKNNFTCIEKCIIHSIYNHNKTCLEQRNKIFKEYTLILIILYKFNIKFNSNLLQHIFTNVPWHENSKKIKKISSEILLNFKFDTYIKHFNNIQTNLPNKYIPLLIKLHTNGFVFYIKNLILIDTNYNKIIDFKKNEINLNDIYILQNLILNDKQSNFCNDKKLLVISDWIAHIFKNILIFNVCASKNKDNYVIPLHKSLDQQIQILINIFIYLIIILHNKKILIKENFSYKKIKTFLILNYLDTFIPELIDNHTFYHVLLYIYSKINKNIFSSKKYIRTLNNYLI